MIVVDVVFCFGAVTTTVRRVPFDELQACVAKMIARHGGEIPSSILLRTIE